MALVQIGDAIVPSIFMQYVQLLSTERSVFRVSGIVQQAAEFDALLVGGGNTFNLPHWNDLDDGEANVSSDAVASPSVPSSITSGQEIAIRQNKNKSWAAADLTAAHAGSDPMTAMASRAADYWVRQEQRTIVSGTVGIMAENRAGTGDMINDIALPGAGTPTAANLFSAEAMIDTIQTMGDLGDQLGVVVMHSVVYSRAKKNDLIDFIPDSVQGGEIPFFHGRRVIVDDETSVTVDNSNNRYHTWVYAPGVYALGEGVPRVPVAVTRDEQASDGGGQEVLTSRREFILHPRGYQWLGTAGSANMAGQSPTFTEMEIAGNWLRIFERRLVRIAELRSNG